MRRVIFWLFIIIFVASFSVYKSVAARQDAISPRDILSLISGSAKVRHFPSPIDHYKLYTRNGQQTGFAVRTHKIEPRIIGYGGEIETIVGIDMKGRITAVKLLSHQESPQYMELVLNNGLFKRLVGLTGEEAGMLDAVTAATVTSSAIIKDVSAAVDAVSKILIGKETGGILDLGGSRKSWKSFLVLLPLSLGGIAIYNPKKRYFKWASLLLSFVIVGLFLNTPITIGGVIDLASGSFFSVAGISIVILMIFAVLFGLIKGPLYCSYICPFGAVQDGVYKILRREYDLSRNIEVAASFLKYVLVIVVVLAVTICELPEFRMIEPFSMCFSSDISYIALIQAGVITLSSLFFRRIWCRCFCPTGVFMDAVCELGVKIRRKAKCECKTK